jgi:hypothetical protein
LHSSLEKEILKKRFANQEKLPSFALLFGKRNFEKRIAG